MLVLLLRSRATTTKLARLRLPILRLPIIRLLSILRLHRSLSKLLLHRRTTHRRTTHRRLAKLLLGWWHDRLCKLLLLLTATELILGHVSLLLLLHVHLLGGVPTRNDKLVIWCHHVLHGQLVLSDLGALAVYVLVILHLRRLLRSLILLGCRLSDEYGGRVVRIKQCQIILELLGGHSRK